MYTYGCSKHELRVHCRTTANKPFHPDIRWNSTCKIFQPSLHCCGQLGKTKATSFNIQYYYYILLFTKPSTNFNIDTLSCLKDTCTTHCTHGYLYKSLQLNNNNNKTLPQCTISNVLILTLCSYCGLPTQLFSLQINIARCTSLEHKNLRYLQPLRLQNSCTLAY